MELRRYKSQDLPQMAELFRESIRAVCSKDYNETQIKAWSDRWVRLLLRDAWFRQMYSIIAVEQDIILGFGNISAEGYLDLLYVHKDYQGQGIATAICDELEAQISGIITVDASITARFFFEGRGYHLLKENTVDVDGVVMTNFTLCKEVGQ